MSNMIRFANAAQAILFECELKGQISDGHWENSRPYDHYKIMCDAKITHAFHGETDGAVIGKNFRPMRKYNFNDRFLIDCVGQRMIGYVKFFTAFPEISLGMHHDVDYEGPSAQEITKTAMRGLNEVSGWCHDRAKRIMDALHVKNVDELTEAMQKVDRVEYTMKMLRKDLKAMSELVNS